MMASRLLLVVLTLLLAGGGVGQAVFSPPAMHEPVVDQAGILSAPTRQTLNQLLKNLYNSGGSQIAVLTISTLNGVSIEEAGIKTAEAWKLGRKGKDDGVILLVAPSDRRMRIEVGRGREGDLTDAYSRRIITEVITPSFKSNDFDTGITNGVAAIVTITDPQFDLAGAGAARMHLGRSRSRGSDGEGSAFGSLIRALLIFFFFGFFILFRVLRMFGLTGGSRFGRHGGYWGGGGGGFGGGGGGWGGGGGGFGGGGSSGSW